MTSLLDHVISTKAALNEGRDVVGALVVDHDHLVEEVGWGLFEDVLKRFHDVVVFVLGWYDHANSHPFEDVVRDRTRKQAKEAPIIHQLSYYTRAWLVKRDTRLLLVVTISSTQTSRC